MPQVLQFGLMGLKVALNRKGLRPNEGDVLFCFMCLKVALNRKGLRLCSSVLHNPVQGFESSPESEGIKTVNG